MLEVKKLADNKLVHAADGTGLPPLHKAIILGHADIVLDLMKSFRESLKLTDNVSAGIVISIVPPVNERARKKNVSFMNRWLL